MEEKAKTLEKLSWKLEVIEQSKRNARCWFIAFLVTLAALVGTNAYWIYSFQSYEYISQDGAGINSINSGIQGDIINEPEGED